MENGTLTKMKLTGYRDILFKKPTGYVYTAVINPETYTLNYEVKINKEQPAGTTATPSPFNLIQPQRLEFEFIFDGTGVLNTLATPAPVSVGSQLPVNEQIDLFKKTVLELDGESHEAPFVTLEWGTLFFAGKVEKLQLIFKLFKPNGTPLRAVAKTTFVGAVDKDLEAAENKLSSPDLTHLRRVQAGDTLPLLCYDIYGDSTRYIEIARVNNLVNFRSLRVGQELFFPPTLKA